MALPTLGISEWGSRAQVLRIQWCFKPILGQNPPLLAGPNVPAISHSTLPWTQVLWVPWIIIPYSVNNFAPNCGLPLRTIFCHYSGWQPAYTISKFHNFLFFSCSVTFFSTLFQPPLSWQTWTVVSLLYLCKSESNSLISWPQLLILFLQLPPLVIPQYVFYSLSSLITRWLFLPICTFLSSLPPLTI